MRYVFFYTRMLVLEFNTVPAQVGPSIKGCRPRGRSRLTREPADARRPASHDADTTSDGHRRRHAERRRRRRERASDLMLGSRAMTFRTLVSLVRDGRLLVLFAMTRAVRPITGSPFSRAARRAVSSRSSHPVLCRWTASPTSFAPTYRCATDWRPGSGSA